MKSRNALLTAAMLLAACGTPQEQCIRKATGDIHRLDRLIATTEDNLARGYAIEEDHVTVPDWEICAIPGTGKNGTALQTSMCFEPQDQIVKREVAIDPAVEKRKLLNLRAKRAALIKASAPEIAACKATYPQ